MRLLWILVSLFQIQLDQTFGLRGQPQSGEESFEHHQRYAEEKYGHNEDADDDADQHKNSSDQPNEGARGDRRAFVPSHFGDVVDGLHQRLGLTLRNVTAGKNQKRPAATKSNFAAPANRHSDGALHSAILLAGRCLIGRAERDSESTHALERDLWGWIADK